MLDSSDPGALAGLLMGFGIAMLVIYVLVSWGS